MTSNTTVKKLLIVDDSKVSRMIIRARVLDIHPDWEIIEATNGTDGVVTALAEKPDFCTMDINMPGILGTDAAELILKEMPHCHFLRQHPRELSRAHYGIGRNFRR